MITIKSHGFKFGRPEANIYFDVSFFKNPWRDERVRDPKLLPNQRRKLVLEFMSKQEGVEEFVSRMVKLLRLYYLLFPTENLIIAFCCSAGEYRSPVIAELVYNGLKDSGVKELQIKQSEYSKI